MPSPTILWDTLVGRYRFRASGRFVPRKAIREAIEDSLANLERRTDSIQADYRAGRISLDVFREEMRDTIKFSQMAAQELAKGGRAQMTPADYGRAGQQIRVQYAYLDGWVADLAGGAPADAKMEGRAHQYLRAARTAFIAAETETFQGRGFDQIRTILHDAEHCAECIAEAARGFVPIGEHTPIGSRVCRSNDACTAEYRNSRTGEVLAA